MSRLRLRPSVLLCLAFTCALAAVVPDVRAAGKELPPDLIQWRKDWNTAVSEAKERNQPVLAVFTSKGCGWCKVMRRRAMPDREFAGVVNGSFVPVQIEGHKELRKQFNVNGNPKLMVIDAESLEIIYRVDGYCEPVRLAQRLKTGVAMRELRESSPEAYAAYCEALGKADRSEKLAALKQLAAEHPGQGLVWVQLGYCQIRDDDPEGAIVSLKRALGCGVGDEAWARYQLAVAYFCAGDYQEAQRLFRLNQHGPTGRHGYFEAANVWVTMGLLGHEQQATDALKAYIAERGYNYDCNWSYGIVRRLSGGYAPGEWEAIVRKNRRKWQKARAAFFDGAYALIIDKDAARAKELFQKTVAYKQTGAPEHYQAKALLARLEEQGGQ